MDKTNKRTYLRGNEIKVGERYFFVNTDFHYVSVPEPIIRERTIFRIVGDDFSTREKGDQYEVERTMAFETKDLAIQRAIKELKAYSKYMNEEIIKAIKAIQK